MSLTIILSGTFFNLRANSEEFPERVVKLLDRLGIEATWLASAGADDRSYGVGFRCLPRLGVRAAVGLAPRHPRPWQPAAPSAAPSALAGGYRGWKLTCRQIRRLTRAHDLLIRRGGERGQDGEGSAMACTISASHCPGR